MKEPLVSILVRTCQRPHILKEALDSISNQSYKNIQAVIVEDGKNESEDFIKQNYKHLNYIYEATNTKKGRCYAGNRALELSQGEYLNFLDDDDLLLPNHVERLVSEATEKKTRVVYSVAEEHIIDNSRKIKRKYVRFRQPFNRIVLCTHNYLPIQSVLFERSLYEQLGGFDENVDTLEDWDLWVRYSSKTDFLFLDEVTSVYHTPDERVKKQNRSGELREYNNIIHEKFKTYSINTDAETVNREMLYVIREYKENELLRYIRIAARRLLYGEK